MENLTGGHFIIACKAWKNRQAGGIGAGPTRLLSGPHIVGIEMEDGAGIRIPADVVPREAAIELVQSVDVAIDDNHVAIATEILAVGTHAFDRRIRRHGIGAFVALVLI